MSDCLFCKIANKEIKSDIVYENKEIIAFRDINPKAPVHVLIVPREHIEKISDIEENNSYLTAQMVLAAKQIASEAGLEKGGYRLVFNCGADAGQVVFHIHLHLLGGRKFSWPPG